MNLTAYNANNQLTTWGTANLFYDTNGNMTSDGTHSYTWDARNRLKQIDLGNTASFTYDPFGRRTRKSIVGAGTTFLYDGAKTVQEVIGGTNTANSLGGGIDEVFQRTDSAGARSFLTDPLGSTLGLMDSTGTLQTQYTFEPFGNTSASGSATTNSFAFTGRELDATGLYYYRARYYNPSLQRFISEDPIGFAGGDANLYDYTGNSPMNFVDPSGLLIGVIGNSQDTGYVNQALQYLKGDPGMKRMIDAMESSSTLYTIITTHSMDADYTDTSLLNDHTLVWNPLLGLRCVHNNGHEYGAILTPAMALGHELAHQRHDNLSFFLGLLASADYTDLDERRVIKNYENPAALTLGEGVRNDHFGEVEWVATPLTKPHCNCQQPARAGRQ